ELGSVSLAGLAQPERVSQLCHPELPAVVAALQRPSSLPAWPTPLVGREQERRDVSAVLAESRLLTVKGAGGSGEKPLANARGPGPRRTLCGRRDLGGARAALLGGARDGDGALGLRHPRGPGRQRAGCPRPFPCAARTLDRARQLRAPARRLCGGG